MQLHGNFDLSGFLKSLGFPELRVHQSFNHFDFVRPSRRILVIGPMGSGKTEYSTRVWRDSQVALGKTSRVASRTTTGIADRRKVFFIRPVIDRDRFPDYPDDALPYRGGYIRCGDCIAEISDSFELEQLLEKHPDVGTWIIDEATFYEERMAYVIRRESVTNGRIFIYPTLILNFRREIFNATARLLLETASDVFPLTAYCEYPDCIADSFYTYRYYIVAGRECPALYFDPLIIIGGDRDKDDPREPNYCTRCDDHHYLPGKEYVYLHLKPLGEQAAAGDARPLRAELECLAGNMGASSLHRHMSVKYRDLEHGELFMNSLNVPCVAEKALIYLYMEENLIGRNLLRTLISEIGLDGEYVRKRLRDNHRLL